MSDITLWGCNGFTYVRTIRMLLQEKGIANYRQVPLNVADRKFQTTSPNQVCPSRCARLRVTGLMLRPSLGAACLAWAIRAAGTPPRRAPGH
jgi:hypothetical protein